MKVKFDTSGIRQTRWYEYLIRFVFGGAVTALAGIVAKRWGPEIGGLFLAFPAIFPATATLLQKNEKRKKERLGEGGGTRGRESAGLDAAGATIGALGLIAFALTVWQTLPNYPLALVLAGATLVWLVTSVMTWEIWQVMRRHGRASRSAASRAMASGGDTTRLRIR